MSNETTHTATVADSDTAMMKDLMKVVDEQRAILDKISPKLSGLSGYQIGRREGLSYIKGTIEMMLEASASSATPSPIIYAPLAHMVEAMDLECQPDENTIIEMLWCDLADMKGEDEAEAYMMRVEDSLDFEFDYHDYHAEWNRGYMADNGWY